MGLITALYRCPHLSGEQRQCALCVSGQRLGWQETVIANREQAASARRCELFRLCSHWQLLGSVFVVDRRESLLVVISCVFKCLGAQRFVPIVPSLVWD